MIVKSIDELKLTTYGRLFYGYSENTNSTRRLYGVKLFYDSSTYFFSWKQDYWEVVNKEGLVVLCKIEDFPSNVEFIGYVDIVMKNKMENISEFNKIERIKENSSNPKDPISRLFFSYRRSLTMKLKIFDQRSVTTTSYEKYDKQHLKLADDFDRDIIRVTIHEKEFELRKNERNLWKFMGTIPNIARQGEISVQPLNYKEIHARNRLIEFRKVLNDPLNHDSSLAKFRKFITENYHHAIDERQDVDFNSIQPTSNQVKIFNNLIESPLTIVDSVAGTGKTTTVVNSLTELIKQNKKILIVTQTHRALDAIIERLQHNDNDLKYYVIRLATKSSTNKVQFKEFLPENQMQRLKIELLEGIIEKINLKNNQKINSIQDKMRDYLEDTDTLDLVDLTHHLYFCTIDALFTQSKLFQQYEDTSTYNTEFPIFDLVVIEDSSDVNFPSLLYPIQFGRRWAIIADLLQSKPVVSSSNNLPPFKSRTLPGIQSSFEHIKNIENEEMRYQSIYKKMYHIDKFLQIQGLEFLKTKDYFKIENYQFKLDKWHRVTKLFGDFIKLCFTLIKEENSLEGTYISRFNSEPIEIIEVKGKPEEVIEDEISGWINQVEITKLIDLLKFLQQKFEGQILKIGIYSPYNTQLNKINKQLQLLNYSGGTYLSPNGKPDIKLHLNSVHNHKNREYDFMILLTTRSQIIGQLKRSDDMFTVFTRAHEKLFILMNIDYANEKWKVYEKQLEKLGREDFGPWSTIFRILAENREKYVLEV